jgi:hypothetical protein
MSVWNDGEVDRPFALGQEGHILSRTAPGGKPELTRTGSFTSGEDRIDLDRTQRSERRLSKPHPDRQVRGTSGPGLFTPRRASA